MKYLFWLSFRDPNLNKWLGGCFVLCDTPRNAVEKTWKLNINPGGEILITPGLEFCDEVLETFNEKGSKLDYLYRTKEEMPGGYERMPEWLN